MSSLTYKTRFTLAAVLLPPCIVSLWMIGAPGAVAISPSTYAAFAALLLALGGVALTTGRNGQAVGSIGQLLHAVDTAQPSTNGRTGEAANANRSDWRS